MLDILTLLDPEDYFATPVQLHPQQCEAEKQFLIEQMVAREFGLHRWLHGEIQAGDFLDLLDEYGVDPVQAVEDWSNGLVYL